MCPLAQEIVVALTTMFKIKNPVVQNFNHQSNNGGSKDSPFNFTISLEFRVDGIAHKVDFTGTAEYAPPSNNVAWMTTDQLGQLLLLKPEAAVSPLK